MRNLEEALKQLPRCPTWKGRKQELVSLENTAEQPYRYDPSAACQKENHSSTLYIPSQRFEGVWVASLLQILSLLELELGARLHVSPPLDGYSWIPIIMYS
jgi:hypothetical protein